MDGWTTQPEQRSNGESSVQGGDTVPEREKQAACLNCRRVKIRCQRELGDSECRKCRQLEAECVIPPFRVGRRKGTKNKRTGFDKAMHRIEQAIERSHVKDGQLQDDQTALHLQMLLRRAQTLQPENTSVQIPIVAGELNENLTQPQSQSATMRHHPLAASSSTDGTNFAGNGQTEDGFALDDAENPLQLLARASDLPMSPPVVLSASSPSVSVMSRRMQIQSRGDDPGLRSFFGPFIPSRQLDLGEDIDPIDMGFITESEANALFTYFYQNLSHTRWGLDSTVHTAEFVRSRSAFLFTSILAASALFLPSTAALSKRLSVHCKTLAHRVMANRHRSPEIVLAFMVNIPWMSPGNHWADDATCSYMAMALTVAVDLSLNKLIIPSPSVSQSDIPASVVKSDCITSKKALSLDGFEDVDPSSTWGRRLLRRRERIWLALFVLDRGVCLARGRSFTVPMNLLVQICDNWHISDISDTWDGSIISSAVLRRELNSLITDIKASCDIDSVRSVDGSIIAQSIKGMIENFFNRWYATWAFAIEGSKQHNLPPYVDILVSHTRLSTYSSVINHPTAPIEVKRLFHAAGLSSSLNVMRAAVQGEGKLKSMPNNTAIMISFAACFALCLITTAGGNSMSLAPSIKILIEETADVLERIGNVPSHRKGMSALYGRHLREVVRNTLKSANHHQLAAVAMRSNSFEDYPRQTQGSPGMENSAMVMPFEPLLFSAMSETQIVEAIDKSGIGFDSPIPDFQIDDGTALDWLDWFSFDHVA